MKKEKKKQEKKPVLSPAEKRFQRIELELTEAVHFLEARVEVLIAERDQYHRALNAQIEAFESTNKHAYELECQLNEFQNLHLKDAAGDKEYFYRVLTAEQKKKAQEEDWD